MNTEKSRYEIIITDEDIEWVESVLGDNIQFDDKRRSIIKNLDSVDVQAFPGSGKTTVLVAKLAILARKWPLIHSGVCVLSHTNVAREEIEERLGNTDVGKKLLTYPHFVGTLHSFFDKFVSLPWLRSKGLKLNIIDSDWVEKTRWNNLPSGIRYSLKRRKMNQKVCTYKESIGNVKVGNISKSTKTHKAILSSIEASQKAGNFTFNEMLLYAQEALGKCSSLPSSIQARFPLLFIDEAQDTNSFQWKLLHKTFNADKGFIIYQGFGDKNQAIYNYIDEKIEKVEFPRKNPLLLSESRRFDNRIATLANPVSLSSEKMRGTINKLSNKECPHTIFLFSKEKARQVIDEFAKLILTTFTDNELTEYKKEGCHVIGMVHIKKEDKTPDKHFPKGIYDYWPYYEAKKEDKKRIPQTLLEYFRRGKEIIDSTGETSDQITWIAKGLRMLINKAKEENFIAATNNCFATVNKLLPSEKQLYFRNIVAEFMSADISTKEKWDSLSSKIMKILELFNTKTNVDVCNFLSWSDSINECADSPKTSTNCYSYHDLSGRTVKLKFGSIHSVKGRTHLATLVLETFSKKFNLKSILQYLCDASSKSSIRTQDQNRLKCHYVAMTRTKGLLCLAIPIEFVNEKDQDKLKNLGWKIKNVN